VKNTTVGISEKKNIGSSIPWNYENKEEGSSSEEEEGEESEEDFEESDQDSEEDISVLVVQDPIEPTGYLGYLDDILSLNNAGNIEEEEDSGDSENDEIFQKLPSFPYLSSGEESDEDLKELIEDYAQVEVQIEPLRVSEYGN
jgi:hypothetical protein